MAANEPLTIFGLMGELAKSRLEPNASFLSRVSETKINCVSAKVCVEHRLSSDNNESVELYHLPLSDTFARSPTLIPISVSNSVVTKRISFQSFKMSSFVVCDEVIVNRITYFPFNDAGTA